MPRDHLLGCQAFLPPEPEPRDRTVHLKRRFPLGVPERKYREMETEMVKAIEDKQQITAFEEFDHTPEEMRDAFPREYDLTTMLTEAAHREIAKMWMDFGVDFAAPVGDATVVVRSGGGGAGGTLSYDALLEAICKL